MRTLVVDPSPLFQQMLAGILNDGGGQCTICANAAEAIGLVRKHHYDLVCVAMYLPDMDGMGFCSHLRLRPEYADIPIVLVTSAGGETFAEAAREAGITRVFSKSEMPQFASYAGELTAGPAETGKVLLVESNPGLAGAIRNQLAQLGLSVEEQPSAETALARFIDSDFDLLFVDAALSAARGALWLVQSIRGSGDERRSSTPILALSAQADVSRKVELLRAGANDYISKPVVVEEFNARVRNLIQSKRLLDKVNAQQERLHKLAMTDQLTSLYNRHYLTDVAAREIADAIRESYPISLIVIDLDFFKKVNDNYGHAIGDLVLVQAAQAIRNSCRDGAIPARIGGEEFVVMLPRRSLEAAVAAAEQLRLSIADLRPNDINVTASMGVATIAGGDPAASFEQLFSAADQGVYAAKEGGRNQVCVADGGELQPA